MTIVAGIRAHVWVRVPLRLQVNLPGGKTAFFTSDPTAEFKPRKGAVCEKLVDRVAWVKLEKPANAEATLWYARSTLGVATLVSVEDVEEVRA